MIRKFHDAKMAGGASVNLWGTGAPRREFLHADDLASACLHLLANYDGDLALNVGTGEDVAIRELAESVARVVDYQGEILWDPAKPDGTPRKLLDVSRLTRSGWVAGIGLADGLRLTYEDFKNSL